jgi:hypothetical protein
MAVFSTYADNGMPAGNASPVSKKYRDIAAYTAVALIAMAVAIPAAIATSGADNAGLFTECFSASCDANDTLALLDQ